MIETIFSQGTSRCREDGLFVNPPFFGVVDGLSAPHNPVKEGPLRFNGLTGGEMARKIVLETFCSASADLSLERVLLQANQRVGKIQTTQGISLSRPDLLSGVSFVSIRIRDADVEIIQGGDCFAIWLSDSNAWRHKAIGATRNQAYKATVEIKNIIAQLMAKHNYDRSLIWDDFVPILSMQRLRDINKRTKTGYALLNGQPELSDCWQKTLAWSTQNLRLMILFSDGFFPFIPTDPSYELDMAEKI